MAVFFNLIRLVRPKEWVKNLFIFAPLFFSRGFFHFSEIEHVFSGFILFCLAASSIYILNDCQDCAGDRLHPIKQYRPIASGKVDVSLAWFLFSVLTFCSLLGALVIAPPFFYVLVSYYAINIAYSFVLKNIAIIDIYCIAAGFILRVIGGAELIYVAPSIWILICTGLLALFLAVAKRRDDFVQHISNAHRESMRGYNIPFIDTTIAILLGALLIAYAIYTTQSEVVEHLGTQHFYWTVPFVLFGMLRYLQITLVEERSGSPTTLLLTDKFLLGSVFGWILISGILMY